MLRAVIFDFNGVIVDDEPIHLAAFREVLRPEGPELTDEAYWNELVGYDDRGVFTMLMERARERAEPGRVQALVEAKASAYARMVAESVPVFPGVKAFIAEAARRYKLGVCSGALRQEIEAHFATTGLRAYFGAIISAEDTRHGKPDPEGYLKALRALNTLYYEGASADQAAVIHPQQCVVIEDSHAGIAAAKAAGMYCVAVPNTYPAEALSDADWLEPSLAEVSLDDWEARIR